MKKHILVISQYFYPENFRINDICAEWVDRGYEVTVVTGIPNYPQGKFYKGFGLFKKRKEIYKGINIIRIPLIPRGNNSIMLALNYLSFVVTGYFWKLFTKIKADYVFIFEVSPMTQALPGVWYAKKKKIPCYIYVQDLWPENVEVVTGISNKLVIGSIESMVSYIYKNTNKILTTSESFAKSIINRNVKKEKVIFWPQYAEDFYHPVRRNYSSGIPNDGKLNVVFTGNIGYAQGLDLLPKVAIKLKAIGEGDKIRFNLVGDGRYRSELKQQIEDNDLTDMFAFYGQRKPTEIPQILSDSDVAYLSFADEDLFNMTIPAKLQSYMACRIPIIASAAGETEKIIEESNAGYCSKTGNVEMLTESILQFKRLSHDEKDEMAQNSRDYYVKNFNKQELMDEVDILFKN